LAAYAIASASAAPLSAVEGAQFSGTVAPAPGTCDPTVVAIDWGDGTQSSATINKDGSFAGTHTYAQAGTYSGTAGYSGTFNESPCAGAEPFQIQVADAPLSGAPVTIVASGSSAFSGPVATFTDANPDATASDFSAQINWGDGATSAGTVAAAGSGFVVNGGHTYAANGTDPVTVTVMDRGGSQTQTHGTADLSVGGGQGGLPGVTKPTYGHDGTIRRVSGTVLVRLPGSSIFISLAKASTIPVGSIIDATRGTVQLVSSASLDSKTTQSADFYQGAFQFDQPSNFFITPVSLPGGKTRGRPQKLGPYTQLRLFGSDFSHCNASAPTGRATIAKAKHSSRSVRHLWGSGHGHFITIGRTASAAVRGTIWLTDDRCDGTLTKVARGIVQVADFPHHRTFALRAGHQYLATG
jgi:hypothetical protein